MSQRSVETIIGRLVTDEGFRGRFLADTAALVEELRSRGWELTPVETQALLAIDPDAIHAFASAIDSRLQKVDVVTQ